LSAVGAIVGKHATMRCSRMSWSCNLSTAGNCSMATRLDHGNGSTPRWFSNPKTMISGRLVRGQHQAVWTDAQTDMGQQSPSQLDPLAPRQHRGAVPCAHSNTQTAAHSSSSSSSSSSSCAVPRLGRLAAAPQGRTTGISEPLHATCLQCLCSHMGQLLQGSSTAGE
jgi:hypothetical protein